MSRLAVLVMIGCGSSQPATEPADAAAPDASTCGLRGERRGKTDRMIEVAGLDRTYIVYLPAAADPRQPMPLVFVHHGYTMSAQLMFDLTKHVELADREQIALVFPDGQGGPLSTDAPWNVGDGVCPTWFGDPPVATGDDFAMLDAIRADVELDQCIDDKHVFVTGFSMGGYFSHHAGCMRPDLAGVAPSAGGTHPLDNCVVDKKPIVIFHGSADEVVPAGCNDPRALAVDGVVPAADAWANHNGCSLTTTSFDVTGGTCRRYDGCPAGGQVQICTFAGMFHCWAGGTFGDISACPTYASATTLQWEFFKQFAW